MKRYISHIIKGAESRTEFFLRNIETDHTSLLYGGLKGEILDAKATIYALCTAMSVYLNKNSKYFKDNELLNKMEGALFFVERSQRSDDGSFDYASCNFRSAPDTAFCFKRLVATYFLLKKYGQDDERLLKIQERYKSILEKSLIIISEGGFHTPNHRWAISAALLTGANIFSENVELVEKLNNRAKQYLSEGIDGDADGDYSEHSTGNYNAVVNAALISCYEATDDENFLSYVKRNLDMMLYYIDDEGVIFTQNSTRQDRGKAERIDKYFYQYLYMAYKIGNLDFESAAHEMICENLKKDRQAPDCLYFLMLHDYLLDYYLSGKGYKKEYRRYFEGAGVYRVKNSRFTYTVLRNKSRCLYLDFKGIMVGLRIGESLAYVRNFIPVNLKITGNSVTLSASAAGNYYEPFDTPQPTKDWWKMDHSKRKILENPKLDMEVGIKELESGVEISLKSEGLDRLPLRVEIDLSPDIKLFNEHFYLKTHPGGSMITRDGYVYAEAPGKTLIIGEAFGEHEFSGHYSGEEKNTEGYSLQFHGYTPIDKKFVICLKD